MCALHCIRRCNTHQNHSMKAERESLMSVLSNLSYRKTRKIGSRHMDLRRIWAPVIRSHPWRRKQRRKRSSPPMRVRWITTFCTDSRCRVFVVYMCCMVLWKYICFNYIWTLPITENRVIYSRQVSSRKLERFVMIGRCLFGVFMECKVIGWDRSKGFKPAGVDIVNENRAQLVWEWGFWKGSSSVWVLSLWLKSMMHTCCVEN